MSISCAFYAQIQIVFLKNYISTGNDRGYAVALQADGKIVIAGSSWNGSNEDFALTRYLGDPDLVLTKSVMPSGPIIPGQTITYTITISNNSSTDEPEVTVVDTLPDGVQGANLNQTVSISANEALTFTIRATVTNEAPYGATITNTASYSHAFGTGQARGTFTIIADRISLPLILK